MSSPADCDSYCKASKGKLKMNMKKYCRKDYGECVGGLLWGGLSVTCVTESLGSVKSHAQECLVSSQSLCTGASRPVGDTEAGIPSLDSVELCSRGLCGCSPHVCSLLFCVLTHTLPFVSSLLLEPGSPALEWVRAMDCLDKEESAL